MAAQTTISGPPPAEQKEEMFGRKDLTRLIIPLVIEQALTVTIGMADTVMVSGVGEAAVSGISLVDTINILLINLFAALATGGAVVAAQYLGRRDAESACKAAKQLLYATTGVAVLISICALIWQNQMLGLVFGDVEEEVMRNAQTYFFLSLLSYPVLAVYNAGAALFRAMGNSRVSMMTSIVMNVINISGNAILIYGAHIGVAGAGIASLLSRTVGAVIMVVLLRNPVHEIHFVKWWKPEFHPGLVKSILVLGVPNGLENSMFQVGKILVQSLIAFFGTAAIAANAVANTIASMEIIPGSSIGLALITVVGQCVGAGDYDQAKRYTVKLMKVAYITMGALNILMLLGTKFITNLYHLTPETTQIATELMLYHGIMAILIWSMSFTLPNALRAAGDVRFTMLTSTISMWAFRIGFSYLLAQTFEMGVMGVWIAMTIDWAFRSVCFLWRFCSGKWKHKKVI